MPFSSKSNQGYQSYQKVLSLPLLNAVSYKNKNWRIVVNNIHHSLQLESIFFKWFQSSWSDENLFGRWETVHAELEKPSELVASDDDSNEQIKSTFIETFRAEN